MATVSFRMDDATKKKFERLCDDLGMSMSTALNVFAKKAVREQRIPFELTLEAIAAELDQTSDPS